MLATFEDARLNATTLNCAEVLRLFIMRGTGATTCEGAQLVAAACEGARLGATTLNCAEDATFIARNCARGFHLPCISELFILSTSIFVSRPLSRDR